jgi:hypothetical protein
MSLPKAKAPPQNQRAKALLPSSAAAPTACEPSNKLLGQKLIAGGQKKTYD